MKRGIRQQAPRGVALLLATVASGCSPAAEPPHLLTPGHSAPIDQRHFGLFMHEIEHGTPWPNVTFGSWRLWDAYVTWADLQPSRNRWDFKRLDAYVAEAASHDVEIVLPLALTPVWASARARESSAYGPGNAAEPSDIENWREYVRRVVTRYQGRIQFYNVWDEPNQKSFFSGEMGDLITLACEAYRIIHELDPAARVISPPPTGKDEGVAWLDRYFAAGGGACADIVGFNFFTWEADQPEEIGRLALAVRQVMAAHGLESYELWNTGTGHYIANARVPNADVEIVLSDERAAAYIIRTFAIAAAGGIRRSFWYAWDNRQLGLIEPDTRAPKAAARAYDTAARWLIGTVVQRCELTAEDLWVCTLTKGDSSGRLVWATDGQQIAAPGYLAPTNGYRFGANESGGLEPTPIDASPLVITETPMLLVSDENWWATEDGGARP